MNQFIVHGNVIAGTKLPRTVNFCVKPFELIKLPSVVANRVRLNLVFRLKNNMIYFNTPRYVFVNSKIMFACVFFTPQLKDISFPVLLDIYRLNDMN